MADCCTKLLSEGLDLCIRARKLDRQVIDAMNAGPLHGVETRCGTPALWVQDQYENDLTDWERRSRQHLMQGCVPDGKGEGG
jgi:hypothetical protein